MVGDQVLGLGSWVLGLGSWVSGCGAQSMIEVEAQELTPRPSFQFRGNKKLPGRIVPLDLQHVGLAAHLAVFHVRLAASGGLINRRLVPFPAGGALKPSLHQKSLPHADEQS